jgi:ABC-type glycerol-3-phosphate transport system substrate-binding protein
MKPRSRQGDKETGRHGERMDVRSSPCLLVSLSPCLRCLLIYAAMLLTGCPRGKSPAPAEKPGPSLTLRVLVVNEPQLAQAINRLRGEWAEQGTGELDAVSTTWADLAAAKSVDADVVVFSSRHLGELCVRGWLRPVRANVLESNDFNAEDFFPVVRREIMKWGGQVMAVPLGVQLVTTDRQRWPFGLGLLAHAAPRVVTRDRLGVLFDSETMKPLIAEPAFVKSLEKMVELSQPESSEIDKQSEPSSSPSPKRSGDESSVPVIGHGDRLAAVTTSSRNAASAFKLLEWLASADISSRLGAAEVGLLPVRRSLANSAKWYPHFLTGEERLKQTRALQEALKSEQCLVIPRMPGIDQYLAVLNSEVKAALGGKLPPQAALDNAEQAWERITDARGRDKQRDAYLRHLGLE